MAVACGCQKVGNVMPNEVFSTSGAMFRCEAAAIAFQETCGSKQETKMTGVRRLVASSLHLPHCYSPAFEELSSNLHIILEYT